MLCIIGMWILFQQWDSDLLVPCLHLTSLTCFVSCAFHALNKSNAKTPEDVGESRSRSNLR